MTFKIYLDLDDTLCNFTKHFNDTIERGGLDRNKFDDYEKDILAHKDWWFKMPELSDAQELIRYVKPYGPYILSAAPEWDKDAIRQKTEYAKKHFGIQPNRINIVRRVQKQDFADSKSILIDDYSKNIKEWTAAGGIGILFKSARQTIRELDKILNT